LWYLWSWLKLRNMDKIDKILHVCLRQYIYQTNNYRKYIKNSQVIVTNMEYKR
jgi:hypothetical protein